MTRIIVSTDANGQDAPSTLLDERVQSGHLDCDNNAEQLIERLGWAITDAENVQADRRARPGS
jgi:hypothetical protein